MSIEFYSTDTDQGTISIIRKEGPAYEVVKQIRVGNAPRGSVKFTKNGRGFVSNTSGNTISELDAFEHKEVGRITVGFGPRGIGIVPGDRYALVSNSGSDTVSVVDLQSRKELTQIAVGADPRHMAITKDGKSAYVSIWGGGHIAKLDISGLQHGEVDGIRQIATIGLGENSNPYSLNIEPAGRYAFVACNAADHIPVIDLASDEVSYRISVDCDEGACGARAVAFSANGKVAFATLERTNAVAAIAIDGMSVIRYIQVGPAPRGIIQDEDVLVISNFSRSPGGAPMPSLKLIPHSVTFVDLNGVDLKEALPVECYSQVRVGHGPCSVSMFDPSKATGRSATTTLHTAAV